MSWTVVEVDGNGVRETRKGGTLAGDQQKPKPKMVTWRMCSDEGTWFRSGEIPEGWVALEVDAWPLETIKQLPEGEEP